ncbi:MAG: hypothetical protein ABIX28_23990 [Vicinamibacterales bacterium]
MQLRSIASAQRFHRWAGHQTFRRTIPAAIAAGLVAIAGLSLSGTLTASNGDKHAECNLGTLRGRYLFANSGIAVPPAFGITVPTPAADAGFHIFNGDGTGTAIVTVRVGDAIVLQNLVAPFDYMVHADCTASVSVLNGPSFDLFVAPDGEEFALIATAPAGNYPATINRRVSAR